MKRILGLDLGSNSIGWALVNEADGENEKSGIIKMGVRTISYDNYVGTDTGKESMDPVKDFRGGKSISCNAGRTKKRGARRTNQRFKSRRNNVVKLLKEYGFITDETSLFEDGNRTTFQTYRLRAKGVNEEISLEEFARVLLMINKKRGYKSSRKAKKEEGDGELVDGMSVAIALHKMNMTPGEYVVSLIKNNKKYSNVEFYRSDLYVEFDRVWNCQHKFYPEILTSELKNQLKDKNRSQTWAICETPFGISGLKRQTKGEDVKTENYRWRVDALNDKIGLEELAVVLQEINSEIVNSSGLLGKISDRSKELYFNNKTVGQYLMEELDRDPNCSLKNQVFYRQDYLDEFEKLWATQAKYHKELTDDLKIKIRDTYMFYQHPLKSQKHCLSYCEFESDEVEKIVEGKLKKIRIGLRVCPKSSPLFQEFKIWQLLNNIRVKNVGKREKGRFLLKEEMMLLFDELAYKNKMTPTEALKLLNIDPKQYELNFKTIEGNRTQAALMKAYESIIEQSGHGKYDFAKLPAKESLRIVETIFEGMNWNTKVLHFDSALSGKELIEQDQYYLWHLLYSFEGDSSKVGNEKLVKKISTLYNFDEAYAKMIVRIAFNPDYGNLSTKAMRKILPFMKEGYAYAGRKDRPEESGACELAGYRHSKRSLTKEELAQRDKTSHLDLLARNSLRNPVVEKILNQMINVVNTLVQTYGRPDEIRIELARELKSSADGRREMTEGIAKATAENDKCAEEIKAKYGFKTVSRNDIIRYRLWKELVSVGYKALYSGKKIANPFDDDVTIEHILPKAKIFDDSFSNKTLEFKEYNIKKADRTAVDYIEEKFGADGLSQYKNKVEKLYADKVISKAKRDKLLKSESEISNGFIERDLRDSQYIARKAREILEGLGVDVIPTNGSLTDRLRQDWGLMDLMKELNRDKYERQGLIEYVEDRRGQMKSEIKNWTKRNDHRHHAVDALVIAFTRIEFIQLLNNLNAKSDKSKGFYTLKDKWIFKDKHNNNAFVPPVPIEEFRREAKRQLESILISIKARNKVATVNHNQLTPRGQLHNETIYGKIRQLEKKKEAVGGSFNAEKIAKVSKKVYRDALLKRLEEFGGDAKKAFTGKNNLDKNPIFLDEAHTRTLPLRVEIEYMEDVYTIRKQIAPDLKIEKVIPMNVQEILENRLKDYGNDPKAAFSNLEENPIWLNKEKGISIKRVTIKAISNATALHDKHDRRNAPVLDEKGQRQPSDFVNTGNNHHVAIYIDDNGKLQEQLVSFFEATARVREGVPVVSKDYNKEEGWKFLFTMKQNEFFVFPNLETGFYPNEIDLLDPDNYSRISPNLYRVQKLATRDYTFRHHLETMVETNKALEGITYKRVGLAGIENIIKVRINHIGQIVSIGEY